MKRTETKMFHFKNGLYTLVSVLLYLFLIHLIHKKSGIFSCSVTRYKRTGNIVPACIAIDI